MDLGAKKITIIRKSANSGRGFLNAAGRKNITPPGAKIFAKALSAFVLLKYVYKINWRNL
jgi:hypothetical protein